MQLWMVGLALSVLVAVAAWDVGRPGNASPSSLLALRAIGGLGLVAMAALALSFGAEEAAGVAALGAAPLIFGLLRNTRAGRRRGQRPDARGAPVGRHRRRARDRAGAPSGLISRR